MTVAAARLKWLFGPTTGGAWGGEPEDGEVVLPCIRGTDFDYARLLIDLSRAPLRGFTRREVKQRGAVAGDLIIEKSGGGETQPVGRAVLHDLDGTVMPTNFAARLRPCPDVDSRFACYLLASLYADGRTRACINQTTGIQNLDLEAFLSTRVQPPSLSQQKAIADYLDAEAARIDALITRKRQMVELLNRRRMTVMTDGVRGTFTSDRTEQSDLVWLDERGRSWQEVKLTLVARLGSGHTPSRDHPEWWVDCTVPWITTGEVAQMRSDRIEFITETREMISKVGIANSSAEIHPAGTVVLCRTASAGYSAIMEKDMATSQDFATWTCGPKLNPRFLLLCLRAMRQDLLGRLAMGSTHKTIYMPDIESLRIPLPRTEEQGRIVTEVWDRLHRIDIAIDSLDRQIDLLAEHRQALIAAAVTGELDIPGLAA
jgi:type I restriction enzyme S subunit